LERKHALAIEVLMQAVVVARAVAQHQTAWGVSARRDDSAR
jgi:hypothetical protein